MMRIFVGVDCDEKQLVLALMGSQGILKGLSTTASPLIEHPDTLGQRVSGMMRGLRGEQNVRMKDFRAIGIAIPSRYFASQVPYHAVEQLKRTLDIAVYIEDRETLAATGKRWLNEVERMFGLERHLPDLDLSVVYGAAKLAIDQSSLGK